MFKFEFKKIWRQNKILPCSLLLVALMIGSLEVSIYFQKQQINTITNNSQQLLANLKKNDRQDQYFTQYFKQVTDLESLDGHKVTKDLKNAFSEKSEMGVGLFNLGNTFFDKFHASEMEATKAEMDYLNKNNIASMLPATYLTNPDTKETNTISPYTDELYSQLTQRFYTKGYEQIWFWSIAGGIFVILTVLNIFFGDILATEYNKGGQQTHLEFSRLHNYDFTKMILTKFAVHLGLSVLIVFAALIVFLLYSIFRTGLGDLRYPVQMWQHASKIISEYLWPWATDSANYFAPLQIKFMSLSNYLIKIIPIALSVLILNTSFVLLINKIIHSNLVAIAISSLVPLMYFVLPKNIYNPFIYLNPDWVINNYLGHLLGGIEINYYLVISGILIASLLMLLITLIQQRRKGVM